MNLPSIAIAPTLPRWLQVAVYVAALVLPGGFVVLGLAYVLARVRAADPDPCEERTLRAAFRLPHGVW